MYTGTDVMVADEGHLIESEVVNYSKVRLSIREFDRWRLNIPTFLTIHQYADWAGGLTPSLIALEDQYRNELEEVIGEDPDTLDHDSREAAERLTTQTKSLGTVISSLQAIREGANREDAWYIAHDEKATEFTPVWAKQFCRPIYQAAQKKVLIMSATLLPTPKTAERLGLEKDEYEFIEIPSTFDPMKSPIIRNYVAPLSKKNLEEKLPELIERMDAIIGDHLPDRGIVHTTSRAIERAIKLQSRYTNQMATHEGRERAKVMERFVKGDGPPILLSPSAMTGLDGRGDSVRWQILMKFPFASLGDPLTAARMKEDSESYAYDANATFIQASGRGTRSAEDYSSLYVLDATLESMLHRWPKHFPKWVKKRII